MEWAGPRHRRHHPGARSPPTTPVLDPRRGRVGHGRGHGRGRGGRHCWRCTLTRAIHILRTGAANVASVAAAFERAGRRPVLTTDPADVATADAVVLPGVGAFGAVAGVLDRLELRAPLGERFAAGRPTLGVCLGLQLLAEASDESPGAAGLGVLPATVRRLPDGVRVPHLGWNRVRAGDGCRILTDGAAYFANSYALEAVQGGWSGAAFEHGGTWVAALERGAVLACQFHPELSGAWGQALLGRWLEVARC